MEEFFPFFLVVFAGLFFSVVFRRIHVPWAVSLILGGILIGPHGLELVTITPTIEFIGQIGLIFLMFMAGLETNLSGFSEFKGKLLWLSFVNGAIPFIVGFGIAHWFGYSNLTALLVGIIFISSSIAIVIPSLSRFNLLHTELGQSVVMTTVIQDIASLALLSVVLQNIDPITTLPLYIFYPLTIIVFIVLRFTLPRIRTLFTFDVEKGHDLFQREFRAIFLVLLGTVVSFELLGLHPIIAGFFAGFILSDSIKSKILKEKIRTISYSIFIPTFFIIIGAETNVAVFLDVGTAGLLALTIVLGSILSKLISGWIGAKSVKFSSDHALLFATSSVPQLSTTLAVAFTAMSLDIIDDKLLTALIALSVVTVVVSPTLITILEERITASVTTAKHKKRHKHSTLSVH